MTFILLTFYLLYLLVNIFIYKNLVKGLNASRQAKIVLGIILFLLSTPLIIVKIPQFSFAATTLLWIGSNWLGFIAIAFTVFFLKLLISLFLKVPERQLTIFSITLILFITFYSLWNATLLPAMVNIEIKSNKIPLEKSGFTIVQLSDIHLRGKTNMEKLKEMVNMVNSANPDLIVITGDFLDHGGDLAKLAQVLSQLDPKYGIYSVTGNHEKYPGIEVYLNLATSIRAKDLNDECVQIQNFINLIGLRDFTQENFARKRPEIDQILEKLDPTKFNILLSHRPENFEFFAENGIDLQLSGHTHAGQFFPLEQLVHFIFKYGKGLKSYKGSQIYTSSGTGTYGPDMRTFSRSELTKIVLLHSEH